MKIPIFLVTLLSICLFSRGHSAETTTERHIETSISSIEDGDVIAFLGDSITCGGTYHKYIYTYWLTRYPHLNFRFINKGIYSDFSGGGLHRLELDVFKEKPNKIFINYGMNDSGASFRHDLYGATEVDATVISKRQELYDRYHDNMEKLIKLIRAKNMTVGLLGPSIYDNTAKLAYKNHLGANEGIRQCIEILKKLSSEQSLDFVDFNAPMLVANRALQAKDPTATVVGGDRIHPSAMGHYLMAHTFLQAQAVPKIVTRVEIDAAKGKVDQTLRSGVTQLQFDAKGLSFDYNPKALPLPVTKDHKLASRVLNLTQDLNQELMVIRNLKKGHYEISMGEHELGSYSSLELEKGVNIAEHDQNPQQIQAQRLQVLIDEREQIERRIRMLRQMDARFIHLLQDGRESLLRHMRTEYDHAKKKGNQHLLNRYQTYFKDFDMEEELDQQLLSLEKDIRKAAQPEVYRVTVSRSAQENVISLASLFQNHMVLQRGKKIPVWGTAFPGDDITIAFDGKNTTTTVSDEGNWKAMIGPLEASAVGRELKVSSGDSSKVIKDVLVGEVWIGSGQSNMEEPMKYLPHPDELKKHRDAHLRVFMTERKSSLDRELSVVQGQWKPVAPENTPSFSGIAYFFGKKLRKALDVPVGVIVSSWGGTRVNFWMSPESYTQAKSWSELPGFYANNGPYNSHLFKGMIAPLIPYGIKGFLWYQGESSSENVDASLNYRYMHKGLIQGWRSRWGDPNLPFVSVQLPTFGVRSGWEWPLVREAFQKNAQELNNVGMVVTIDAGESNNIHPRNKKLVGRRLAEWALANSYGKTDMEATYPGLKSIEVHGDAILAHMNHVGTGLVTGKTDVKNGFTELNEKVQSFIIAGQDKKFFPATVEIINGHVLRVSSPKVQTPVAIRYAWANDPVECNLFSKEGQPASPFRSDNWDKAYAFDKEISGPSFSPSSPFMSSQEVTVTMRCDHVVAVHYTTDGSEPTANSPIYTNPIKVKQHTRIKAVGIDDRGRTTDLSSIYYYIPPATPSTPKVWLDNLSYLKGTTGYKTVTKGQHFSNAPLTVMGARYDKGLSVHAPSRIMYSLDPSYTKFVSSIGLQDSSFGQGKAIFMINIDGKTVATSPKVSQGMIWHFEIDIPVGSKNIELILDESDDRNAFDHGNWLNAGFLLE